MFTRKGNVTSTAGLLACLALGITTVGCLVEQRSSGWKSAPLIDSESREQSSPCIRDHEKDARLAEREREEDEDAEFSDGAAAIEFRRQMRLDSNGQIEPGALLRAKQQADEMFTPR